MTTTLAILAHELAAIPSTCPDCDQPTRWDEDAGDWRHVNPAVQCFLNSPAEPVEEADPSEPYWMHDEDPAYLQFCEGAYRDDVLTTRAGLAECPHCGLRLMKVTAIPTRQYGGGWDTAYECQNTGCGYKDIAT